MGKEYVRFRCHHCLHCCTKVVCLPTPADVIRIVQATGRDPLSFLEFVTSEGISSVDPNDPTWLDCGDERYLMALWRPDERCVFLDHENRRCGIYEDRPILCRLYPFKARFRRDGVFKGFGLHGDVECPRHQDGEVAVAPLYALLQEDEEHQCDYEDLVRVFNRKQYPGKRPEDFIGMFVERN